MDTYRYIFITRFVVLISLGAGLFADVYAQSTLVAGDIAFTGYNSNNNGAGAQNDFSFVALTDITAGTNIRFTDNGYKIAGTNALNTAEGTLSWTATTALPRFTQVYIRINEAGDAVLSVSAGTIDPGFSNFILSQGGDQVLAYQGSSTSPNFISGIHMNSETSTPSTAAAWDNMASTTNFTSTRSDIPPGLTNGTDAIMVVPNPGESSAEKDNSRYNCTGATSATVAAIRSAINNVSNWDIQDITRYSLPPACTFAIGTTLYVGIRSFNARKEHSKAILSWVTWKEINNTGFELQRSTDGKAYQTIGFEASKAVDGNSTSTLTYDYVDKTPFNGMNFYRLAGKDKNGNITYSNVRTLNFDGLSDFICYPNPVRNQLAVVYNARIAEAIHIRITDMIGKVIKSQTLYVVEGFNKTDIDMSGFKQGIYNMAVINSLGAVYISSITKI